MILSIIIPIYNVENTLRRCLDSVLSQGVDDCEIILVDDGSIDNSGNIADEYAQKNENIQVFHKKNGGLSDARNYGIKQAKGRYIGFVDSDDALESETLKHLIEIIHKHPEYDVLEFPMLENPGEHDEHLFLPKENVYNNPMEWLEEKGFEHCWVCNKIFKKNIFNHILFSIGKIYEDVYFTGELLKLRPIIATTSKGKYLYYRNNNGITVKNHKKGLGMLLDAQMYVVGDLKIDTREKRWNRIYLNMLTAQLYDYKVTGRLILWSQRIVIRKYNGVNDYIKSFILNVLGLKITCLLFKWFHTK